ncbi:MAG: hypothetical protein ABII20_06575 [Candidatus Omnitrophota bacterium]|nr:hypothetical protein [Candidatus Omnitrophota bacterium]MBU4122274.1 hypothetical protein [bacterium]
MKFYFLIFVLIPLLAAPSRLSGAPPAWFVSPSESSEKFYFLASSSATDKAEAQKVTSRKLVMDSSSYVGKHFDRTKLDLIKEAYDKDIGSGIYICYMLASYPRADAAAKELREAWRIKEINSIFTSSVKKSKKLAAKDQVIEAIMTLSAAKANDLLPDVKKSELENMIKELVTRVKVRNLEYPRAGDTKTELRGDIGVLVSVVGRTDQPVRGVNVDFTFARNTGLIEPVSVMTDKKGLAAVKVKRFNRPGDAVIQAAVSGSGVPEFAYIVPAQFQIEVGGGRVEIMKSAMPVRRGGTKKQNIVFLEDNLPAGVLSLEIDLRPDKLVVSAKLVPSKDVSGFIVDKQAHVDGVKFTEVSKDFSIDVEKIKEGDNFSIEVDPFEIIIIAQKVQREKIKLPLGGEKDTIQQLLVNCVLLYL